MSLIPPAGLWVLIGWAALDAAKDRSPRQWRRLGLPFWATRRSAGENARHEAGTHAGIDRQPRPRPTG
jgi:hypothetical protein